MIKYVFFLSGFVALWGCMQKPLTVSTTPDKAAIPEIQAGLLFAIDSGRTENLKIYLDELPDLDFQTEDGRNPLITASENGNLEIVKLLTDRGADPGFQNIHHDNALVVACRNNHAETALFLANTYAENLNLPDREGYTPLHYAIKNRNTDLAEILLIQGANPDILMPDHCTPLWMATDKKELRLIDLLLTYQSNAGFTNAEGLTLFDHAFQNGNFPVCMIFIRNGLFDPGTIREKFLDAIRKGNLDLIRLFVEAGIDPDFDHEERSGGYSVPIVLASGTGQTEIVEYLLEQKPNVDRIDCNTRETALLACSKNGHALISGLLVKAGCNIAIPDANGITAVETAARSCQNGILKNLFSGRKLKNSAEQIENIVSRLKINKDSIIIHVSKVNMLLSVRAGNEILKQYDISLGFNPVDDKLKQGDGCTPEGTFSVVSQVPYKNSWFFNINYPTKESWQKFDKAKAQGLIPGYAKIGGQIGIHGIPDGCDYIIDDRFTWTAGCIALKNHDIDELKKFIHNGTKIIISKY